MKHVLVPLDGSPFAELALPVGIDIARRHGARLTLVLVHQPSPAPPAIFAPGPVVAMGNAGALGENAALREASQRYLERMAGDVGEQSGLAVTPVLLTGSPKRALIAHIQDSSDEQRPDLVVMSTHGRGGLNRLWLGSVADAVMRHVAVPVLLLKTPEGADQPESPPALLCRRVLVPLDGSALSERAVDAAVSLCGVADAHYVLASVTEPVTAMAHTALAAQAPALTDDDARGAAERYLAGVADRLGARGLTVRVVSLVDGNPARVLLELAEQADCTLVAMTTHGLGGWQRTLLGSVTDKVIRGTDRAVLVWSALPEGQVSEGNTERQVG